MNVAPTLLPEFEQETANTRKVLERIPDDKIEWKAHPKSNSIGWVASHLVNIPGWVEGIMTQDAWDIHPPGGEMYVTKQLTNRQDILAEFDNNVASAKKALSSATDEELAKTWSLLMQGNAMFTMPRLAALRTWVFSHSIHHRAFLCVYLRLNDVPVPGMYGPSGDE